MHINVTPDLLNFSEVILWHQIQKHWSEKLTTCPNKEAGKSHHEYIFKMQFSHMDSSMIPSQKYMSFAAQLLTTQGMPQEKFHWVPNSHLWDMGGATDYPFKTWQVVGKVFGSIVQKLVSFFFEILPYPTMTKVVSPLTTEPLLSWLLTKFIYNS